MMYRKLTAITLVLTILLSLTSCRLKSALFRAPTDYQSIEYTFCAWNQLRKQFKLSDYTQQMEVKKHITWLTKNQKFLMHLAENAPPYLDYITKELHKRGLPAEIALLPMVESAYNPFAYSNKGAAGLWQLMPLTASGYKVQRNWWYDGRRDLEASTLAAIDFLKYLHRTFGKDWLLAFAAYNAGPGKVQQAINRNIKQGKKTDFWSLDLPRETQNYVPRILALATVIRHPQRFNVHLPTFEGKPYFEVVEIGQQIDLTLAAKLAQMDTTDLYLLNPGYNRWVTHPDGPHKLLLPIEKISTFKHNLQKIQNHAQAQLNPVDLNLMAAQTYQESAPKQLKNPGIPVLMEKDKNTLSLKDYNY